MTSPEVCPSETLRVGAGNISRDPVSMRNPVQKQGETTPACQDKVSLTIHEPVNATFALRYLVNFSKA